MISKLISNSLCSYCLSKISENNSNPFFGFQFRGIETKIDHNFLLIFVHKFSLQTWLCKVVIKSFCLIVIFEFDNSNLRLSRLPKHFNRHDNIRVIPAIRTANYFLQHHLKSLCAHSLIDSRKHYEAFKPFWNLRNSFNLFEHPIIIYVFNHLFYTGDLFKIILNLFI